MALTAQQVEQRLILGHEGFYFTGGESLRLTSLNSITGVTVTAAGRFLPSDQLKPSDVALSHTPNTDRTSASSDFIMGEGWLQSLTLVTSGGSPVVGSTYVRVDVVRGGGASATVLATLLQGFVTAGMRLAWPGSDLTDPFSAPGRIRSITGSDPAAGAEISETVPTGARWRLIGGMLTLTCDATVATRTVSLTFDDGTTTYARVSATGSVAASTTSRYNVGSFPFAGVNTVGNYHIAIPRDVVLPAGHRIQTLTSSLQAGDNFGAPQWLVEEWIEGA